ncbi:RagB/SusD family nutrient uptake outer membrane protein [Chitinophaga sp. S165]|uniref:RagB/SusD family nutrient uptake outer membrane protein n=1 Tax=Chitinophaga sp. S165 TaxID=2135462 RepID=UPI000D91B9D7|nr:RagB/SusD family nutrient uptake outer membrane protein [Chitinophaga sp. S165]PWV55546.1 putative outer membrane starch-binding protein [Chitinophaga sp. S165]
MTTNCIFKCCSFLIIQQCKIRVILICFAILAEIGCKKLVEVPPPNNIVVQPNVYTDNASAIATLTAIYTNMTNSSGFSSISSSQSISLLSGLSADELTLYSGVTNPIHIGYYKNSLSANNLTNGTGWEHWTQLYSFVFLSNSAIEGLNSQSANALDPAVKKQLMGEARFLRAFYYFYLVNLFGDVPIAMTSDYKINSLLARSPKTEVYKQIIADLLEAEQLLSENYVDATLLKGSTERVRPIKWAATALLARVYLYTGNYLGAEEKATNVVNNAGLYSLPALNDAFLKNSEEAIWQLQPTTLYFNTQEAITFIIPSTGPTDGNDATNPVYISPQLLNSFEAGDERGKNGNWINVTTVGTNTYYFPYKYKNGTQDLSITNPDAQTEYLMVLRLGEQYLIRAEARAQQNNITGAQNDLNAIRSRAGLIASLASDKESILSAIYHERQVELFTEWGHRWLDLKRTGTIDAVMATVTPMKANGDPWKSSQQWYPLPLSELQRAPNLVQTPGY